MIHKFRLLADQPLAAHRKPSKVGSLGNSAALKQRQGTASSPQEHKRSPHLTGSGGTAQIKLPITGSHLLGAAALEPLHTGAEQHIQSTRTLQWCQQHLRQAAEIHIHPSLNTRGSEGLMPIPSFHHQRNPFGDLTGIRTPLHRCKRRQSTELAVPLLQKRHILLAPHEAQVGNTMQKTIGLKGSQLRQ